MDRVIQELVELPVAVIDNLRDGVVELVVDDLDVAGIQARSKRGRQQLDRAEPVLAVDPEILDGDVVVVVSERDAAEQQARAVAFAFKDGAASPIPGGITSKRPKPVSV